MLKIQGRDFIIRQVRGSFYPCVQRAEPMLQIKSLPHFEEDVRHYCFLSGLYDV